MQETKVWLMPQDNPGNVVKPLQRPVKARAEDGLHPPKPAL